MESNFATEIRESEQAFIKQFDPTSNTYHHGDPTPVPTGGDRVPDSMPTVYDVEYMKRAQENENVNYGAEYEQLMEFRTLFQDLKKILNLVCPPLEAVLRIKGKGGDENQKEKQIAEEMKKVEQTTQEIQKMIDILRKTSYAEKYVDGLETICKDAFKKFKDKEDYTNYGFLVKRYTSMCFSEATEILNKMKKIKASYKPS